MKYLCHPRPCAKHLEHTQEIKCSPCSQRTHYPQGTTNSKTNSYMGMASVMTETGEEQQ